MNTTIKLLSVLILGFLCAFTATALAAGAVVADDTNLYDLLKPVYEAFLRGDKLYAGMLALVLVVALLKRYAPEARGFSKWVHSDTGGMILTLVASFAGAMSTALGSGIGPSWTMVKTATLIAVGAAGGYRIVKRLLVDPFLRPWAAKAPDWLKPVIGLVLWIFDRPSPVAQAEAAGQAAVDAKPPTGIAGVVGNAKDVE